MRLLLLVLLVALPAPVSAAISYGQAVSCQNLGSTSCTTSSITTTGNLLVAQTSCWCDLTTAGTVVGTTDSKSNTYTGVTTAYSVGPGVQVEYKASPTVGSSHTFTSTVLVGGTQYAALSVIEVLGAAAAPLDQTATGADGVGCCTAHATANTATTAQANEILLGIGGTTDADPVTYTQTGTGWTEASNISPFMGLITGYRVVSATGAYAYTFSTSGDMRSAQIITTWKDATAAAGVRQRCVGCGADGKVIE
jgi:hypothetical protein